jgi:hypothetical protein
MADHKTPQQKAAEERGAAQAKTAEVHARTAAADRPVDQQSAEEQQRAAADAQAAQSGSTSKSASVKSSSNLAPASESGDAEVHRLLAERQSATMNGDEDAVKALDKQLANYGVEAG